MADRSVLVSTALSDLERRGVTDQNFLAAPHNYARTVQSNLRSH